ncbi:MAG: nucleotidyltransferase family protein, partial [Betaproteobacteria bacterium]
MPSRFKHWLSSPASPETELLLYCARVQVDAEASRNTEKIVGGRVDWEKFHKLAVAHRVVPLVHRTLDNLCREAMPQPVRDSLAKAVTASREHNKNNLKV